MVIYGGCFLNVMPAKAVPVKDEEDLPPLAEEAGRVVPHNPREKGGGQRGVDRRGLPGPAHPVLATTRHLRGPPHTAEHCTHHDQNISN